MALYSKQDFTPPVLSRKWIAIKLRPNMQIYSHQHIISILESGLLFREDSIEVEQEAPSPEIIWKAIGGSKIGWFTRGEQIASVFALGACIAICPPRSLNRSSLLLATSYLLLPACIRTLHRRACRGCLDTLLAKMRDYLALARRAAACLRDCTQLHHQLDSVSQVLESMHTMLCRQQSELSVTMSRASAALLGNAPWVRSDVAWGAVQRDHTDNLMKIHHAFLVVQSTLLKHIAMAHYIPSAQAQKLYKNHNERIYWIHNTLIQNLIDAFTENYDALERMYRLLKNFGSVDGIDNKKLGDAVKDNWLYSEVHSGIARANLELKVALNKCNHLDSFLDSCALNEQEIDLNILNNDIDNLIDDITKCLSTVESSQIRLKKLQNKFVKVDEVQEQDGDRNVVDIEHEVNIIDLKEPETKDEVFYFVKTDDDDLDIQPCSDLTTGPGKKEKEATKMVLNELKRKLVRREDVMRERERQALVKTMPELKDNLPEFPRQINIEEVSDQKGYISKLARKIKKKRKFQKYKIHSPLVKHTRYRLKTSQYEKECDMKAPAFKVNIRLSSKPRLLSVVKDTKVTKNTEWFKKVQSENEEQNDSQKTPPVESFSDLSEGLSDVEAGTANKAVNQAINHRLEVENINGHRQNGDAVNVKFSKKDLELSDSVSESESDFEAYKERQMALLRDVRRHRAARKKNHPPKKGIITLDNLEDESLRPIEAERSLGARLAMASVLHTGRAALGQEEVFQGDGELSPDSGNDEDA